LFSTEELARGESQNGPDALAAGKKSIAHGAPHRMVVPRLRADVEVERAVDGRSPIRRIFFKVKMDHGFNYPEVSFIALNLSLTRRVLQSQRKVFV